MTTGDLTSARRAVELAEQAIGTAVSRLTELGGPDAQQVFAYDLAHAGAGVATARAMVDYGEHGDTEARLACGFAADVGPRPRLEADRPGGAVGRRPGAARARTRLRRRASRPRVPRLARHHARPASPPRRHGDGDGHVPRVRRRRDRAARRARAPHQRRRARGDRHRARRARRVRARRCPPSTAGSAKAAPTSTSPWSSPPRSSAGPASASAAR